MSTTSGAWIAAVLLAGASNLDNLLGGIALGLARVRVTWIANVVIAAVTVAGTVGAMLSGAAIAELLPTAWAHALAALALLGTGAWMVAAGARGRKNPTTPSGEPAASSLAGPTLSCRKAVAVGAALSLNNLSSGVPAGAAGLSPVLVAGLAGAFSLACVGGGAWVGSRFAQTIARRYVAPVGGVMMVALAVLAVAR